MEDDEQPPWMNQAAGGSIEAATQAVSSDTLLQMAIDSLSVVRETQAHLEAKHNKLFGAQFGQEDTAEKQSTDNLYTVLRQIKSTSQTNLKLSQSL